MKSIETSSLADDLPFGARIRGVTLKVLEDEEVRQRIKDTFDERGVIVFEELEPSNELQVALSGLFGPPQEHAMRGMPRVDQKAMPSVVDLDYKGNLVEIDGKPVYGWVSWHFDACYTAKLNRGGVLRAIEVPPEGGLTGFADGVQLYQAISSELREQFEAQEVLYHPTLMFMNQRFGKPKGFRVLNVPEAVFTLIEQGKDAPRSVHRAIWRRRSGERVLHVSPWQAAGLLGREDAEGDALLETLCQEMYGKMRPYWHQWKMTDMIAWDNWRVLHAVSGNDPKYSRRMQRTTIEGDYGLGRFETSAESSAPAAEAPPARLFDA